MFCIAVYSVLYLHAAFEILQELFPVLIANFLFTFLEILEERDLLIGLSANITMMLRRRENKVV